MSIAGKTVRKRTKPVKRPDPSKVKKVKKKTKNSQTKTSKASKIPKTTKKKPVQESSSPEKLRTTDKDRSNERESPKKRWNNRVHKNNANTSELQSIRDISEAPEYTYYKPINLEGINWERRLVCKHDPELCLRTYFPDIFKLPFGDFHKELIRAIEVRIDLGGRKIIACPRASGKTAICRGMIMRAMMYGIRKFPFFIGSKEPKAVQTLDAIKANWYRNLLLRQDFPEFAYPVYRIEGRATAGAAGQMWKGEITHLIWKSDEIQLPTLLFTEGDVQPYLKNDPDSVEHLKGYDRYIIKGAGCLVRVTGIDGSIRGEADAHPIFLTQPRPDLILLDDIVKDQKADSPKACEDLERLIESAIGYLAGPGSSAAIIWPGTVIREDDPTDNYLDHAKHQEWNGLRTSFVQEYPDGIDDYVITEETEQGKLWLEYEKVLKESYRVHENLKLANEFYIEHREVLDAGFKVSWDEMYVRESRSDDVNEVSAIQSAMNRRFTDHISYLSEVQNRPSSKVSQSSVLMTSGEIAEKITHIPRNIVIPQWTKVVGFIDVQTEILFYGLLAFDHAFNGQFIDYGTFPPTSALYFRKNQTYGWALLTKLYYEHHFNERPDGYVKATRPRTTRMRAPLEPKVYFALKQCCDWMFSRRFYNQDEDRSSRVSGIAIDTRWGETSDVVKRFVREYNNQRVIAYMGHSFPPGKKPLEEYNPQEGWLFEHEQFPHVKESKWVMKPGPGGGYRIILADVSRLKSFLHKRLATPSGSQGCITLYEDLPERHTMFADHLAKSEIPTPTTLGGVTKEVWIEKPNMKGENDYLDVAAGCVCMASVSGASLKEKATHAYGKKPKSLREIYEEKKRVEASRRKTLSPPSQRRIR